MIVTVFTYANGTCTIGLGGFDRLDWVRNASTKHVSDDDGHVFFAQADLDLTRQWCATKGYQFATSAADAPWPQQEQPKQTRRKRQRLGSSDDEQGVAAVTDGSDDEDLDDATDDELREFINDESEENSSQPLPLSGETSQQKNKDVEVLEKWLVDNRQSVLLTGGSGTAKTETIVHVVEMLGAHGLKVLLTASTGEAADNLRVRLESERHLTPSWPELPKVFTIDSADAFSLQEAVEATQAGVPQKAAHQSILKRPASAFRGLKGIDVIIVDEISMVSAEKLQLIKDIAKKTSAPKDPPRFLLVGDFYQLQPVEGEPCFDSPAMLELTGGLRRVHVLTTSWRTRMDPHWTHILGKIRVGNFDDEVIQCLMSMSRSEPPEGAVCISPVNKMCAVLNRQVHDKLKAAGNQESAFALTGGQQQTGIVTHQGKATIIKPTSSPKVNALRDQVVNSLKHMNVRLCVNETVILKANLDVAAGHVNGVRGVVVKFGENKRVKNKPAATVTIKRLDNGEKIVVPYTPSSRDAWSDMVHMRATTFYLPLLPATAITVHNAQGRTIKDPLAVYVVDENGQPTLFGDQCRLLYVALGRAPESQHVFLVGFDKVDVARLRASCVEANERLRKWEDRIEQARQNDDVAVEPMPVDTSLHFKQTAKRMPVIHRVPSLRRFVAACRGSEIKS